MLLACRLPDELSKRVYNERAAAVFHLVIYGNPYVAVIFRVHVDGSKIDTEYGMANTALVHYSRELQLPVPYRTEYHV